MVYARNQRRRRSCGRLLFLLAMGASVVILFGGLLTQVFGVPEVTAANTLPALDNHWGHIGGGDMGLEDKVIDASKSIGDTLGISNSKETVPDASIATAGPPSTCPDYITYASSPNPPLTSGIYKLPFQRPALECRAFVSPEVEESIKRTKLLIRDPDLSRLFENAFPNTLDTAVRWRGFATAADGLKTDEELAFLITGDINAMWLRDSANQVFSYSSLLTPSTGSSSLASLFRGVINLQARYITTAPFCNAFLPPAEAVGVPTMQNPGFDGDKVRPKPQPSEVWECKYELDSLASFLQLSHTYYNATRDAEFFFKHNWLAAVRTIINTARAMQTPTYAANGVVAPSAYTFERQTTRATETLQNDGEGSPVARGTGLVRSAFRPSDDSTTFQLLVPSNWMFAAAMTGAREILDATKVPNDMTRKLSEELGAFSAEIRAGVDKYARARHPEKGEILPYEVDGFGSVALMDDANIPSLLSLPLLLPPSWLNNTSPLYTRTRSFILSSSNPYFATGPVLSSVGGPHLGPGSGWPMASIVRILTSSNDTEIYDTLKSLIGSTDGLGLMHESVDAWNASRWTRAWFGWANGLFGQMVLDLAARKKDILARNY